MRQFITVILLLAIVGCGVNDSGNGGEDSIYPFQIETWSVQSQQMAQWTGLNQVNTHYTTQSADTILITDTENHHILINNFWGEDGYVSEGYEEAFQISFIDSTLNKAFRAQYNVDTWPYAIKDIGGELEFMHLGPVATPDDSMWILFVFQFDCGKTYNLEDDEIIQYTIRDKNGDDIFTKQIVINGIIPTADHIVCHNIN